jgi:surfeit locus 1 family protein
MTVENSVNPKSIIEFKLGSKHYHFSPRPLATLATVIVFPLLLVLGFWQLHRADIKREVLELYQTNSAHPPAITYTKITEPFPKQFQRVSVRGHFIPSQQILLDNRFHEHQVGYQVITPFKLEESNTYLFINRGWIPRSRSRTIIPTFETPPEKQIITLSGYASYPKESNFLVGPNLETPKPGTAIVQSVQIDQLSEIVQHPAYPFILLLDEQQNHGFTRSWTPVTMGPDTHLGYAVQWFALAASLVIIYVAVNLRSEKARD